MPDSKRLQFVRMGFKLGILRLKADERVVAMGVSADVKDDRSYQCASRLGTLAFPRYSGTTERLKSTVANMAYRGPF
jgi:hypothetical protein